MIRFTLWSISWSFHLYPCWQIVAAKGHNSVCQLSCLHGNEDSIDSLLMLLIRWLCVMCFILTVCVSRCIWDASREQLLLRCHSLHRCGAHHPLHVYICSMDRRCQATTTLQDRITDSSPVYIFGHLLGICILYLVNDPLLIHGWEYIFHLV